LTFLLVLAGSVWLGGLVTIAVVARVARRTLGAEDRVTFFRDLGRTYGVVGGLALATALVAGAVLVMDEPLTGPVVAAWAVAAALVGTTLVGVRQARQMTQLRLRAAAGDGGTGDPRMRDAIHRGAVRAAVLRGLIAALSVALLSCGVLAGF
jgi:hypothetical protein